MVQSTMRRISVVGTSGSGKTTLAQQLAQRLNCPHVELDAIHWQPNWKGLDAEIFREKVGEAISGDTWTIDGNYSIVRDLVWRRADVVVWLDYPLWLLLWRVFRRSLQRSITREDLWNTGNRESMWTHLFTRDSLLLWVLKTYRRRKRQIPTELAKLEYAHLQLVRLHSPKETEHWLAQIQAAEAS